MKLKEKFWYESNQCWGWVETIEELSEKCKLQTDINVGALNNADEFLDKSRQNDSSESLDFGTRREHRGEKTLREYLEENGDLDNFLKFIK